MGSVGCEVTRKFSWKALKVHTLFQPLISAHKCTAQRPMCDGRSSASSLFRRLSSRGAQGVFPFFMAPSLWWPLQVAIYLCTSVKSRMFTSDTTGKPVKLSVIVHITPHLVTLMLPVGLGGAKPFRYRSNTPVSPKPLRCRISPLRPATCFDCWTQIQPMGVHVQAGMLPLHEDAHDSVPACDVMLHDLPKHSSPTR